MKVTYRVISTITGNDLTDKEMWVLEPNGRLAYNRYGDLISDICTKAIFNVEDIEHEQTTGTWLQLCDTEDKVRWKCSSCGKETDLPNHDKAAYCFNCGAKMN